MAARCNPRREGTTSTILGKNARAIHRQTFFPVNAIDHQGLINITNTVPIHWTLCVGLTSPAMLESHGTLGECAGRANDWAVRYPTTDVALTVHTTPSLFSSGFLAMDPFRLHCSRHPGRPSVCGASTGTAPVPTLLHEQAHSSRGRGWDFRVQGVAEVRRVWMERRWEGSWTSTWILRLG